MTLSRDEMGWKEGRRREGECVRTVGRVVCVDEGVGMGCFICPGVRRMCSSSVTGQVGCARRGEMWGD